MVGLNNKVKIYDLGISKLLNKCENRQIPNMVVSICSAGNRVFAADITDSVHVLKYRKDENKLSVFADDVVPRWSTCVCPLDASTVAIGDKLGNVTICRLDENVAEDLDNDTTTTADASSNKWLHDKGYLNGAPQRFSVVASFFVASGLTSIQKYVFFFFSNHDAKNLQFSRASLTAGGIEVILYTTMNGTIGCLSPLSKPYVNTLRFSHNIVLSIY